MEITTLQIVLVFIVACIAGMESVLDEFQFHRPLIACTLIGAVLGDMKTGIIIGGTLEMIALGWMNIGAAVAPDAALASIISTVLVIAGHQSIGAGIALAIPLAAAGQVLTIIVRTITVAFQHAADKAAENGNLTALSWLHVSSLFLQAMRIAIPAVIVAISVGTSEVQGMLNAIPEVVTGGLNIAGGMIVVVGYAMVINMMRAGYLMPFFYLGFVTAAFTNFNLVALGVIGAVMAITEKKLTPSDIRGVFLRSNLFQGSWNFERMQALGFCFSMVPAIRRLYPENNDARKQAIKRHLEFFNTHPYVAAPVLGVTLAMEEKRANGAEIDDGAINGIKVGLMGPLAGVGDPIFWGTVRPVFAALGAGIAMSGSLLGPLLFFILFNLVRLATRYYGVAYGYRKGVDIVKDMGGGFLQKLTEGASILGLFVMGALVNKWTHVNIPLVVSTITGQDGQTRVTTVQTILDQLMPGLVPLLLTFACMWLLRKKVNPLWIIVGFFVIGIAGYSVGLLGQ